MCAPEVQITISLARNAPEAAMKLVRYAALYLLAALVAVLFADGVRTSAAPPASNFVLVAHCGAGDYSKAPAAYIQPRRDALAVAIRQGYKILAAGGASLDAVETTIRSMEDSGLFDAGRGAYYTRAGVPEMDAAIMDGQTLAAGSVACLQHIANPIHLARLVMEKTPHVMLVGAGAEEFAKSQGIELVSPFYFYNEQLWLRYKLAKSAEQKKSGALKLDSNDEHGTVGVVALDQQGNLAAGTSTGGTVLKMPGRVGDSPIIGAGTYANNESCGVSATGTGEFFMRNIVAADICERVRYLHVSLEQAANDVVMKELVDQHGEGGVIALDHQGNVTTPFNTTGMMTGTVRGDGKISMKGWSKTAEPIIVSASQ
jgi:beta-aspartyl-peptidase (threonine type)